MKRFLSRLIFAALILVTGGVHAKPSKPAKLSEYEIQLIRDYTSQGYLMNHTFANILDRDVVGLKGPMVPDMACEEGEFGHRVISYRTQLNKILAKIPAHGIPGKTTVYRGIYHTSEEPIENRFYKGRVWIERRFSSSTTDKKVAEDFAMGAYKNEGCGGCDQNVKEADPKNAVIISIVNRTGVDIAPWSLAAEEKEVLFRSGTIFKVVEAKRDPKGRYLVSMEELDPAKLSGADKAALDGEEEFRANRLVDSEFQVNHGSGASFDPIAFAQGLARANQCIEDWKRNNSLEMPISFDEEGGG